LIRFREAQEEEQTRIKQQIMAFLLRKGIEYPEQINWNKKFHNWLATLEMEDPQDRIMLHRYPCARLQNFFKSTQFHVLPRSHSRKVIHLVKQKVYVE
jgi:hypothetical protein